MHALQTKLTTKGKTIRSTSEPLTLPPPTPSTSLPLFWDCNWAASGKLPGLHSAVGNGACMCMCVLGGCWGPGNWSGRVSSLAGQESKKIVWTLPLFSSSLQSASHLLVYFPSAIWRCVYESYSRPPKTKHRSINLRVTWPCVKPVKRGKPHSRHPGSAGCHRVQLLIGGNVKSILREGAFVMICGRSATCECAFESA